MPRGKSTGARSSFEVVPIGVVRGCYASREEAPRQGINSQKICRIEIFSKYASALEGIEEWQELLILCWMHLAKRDVLYSDTHKRGIFATRSPERPNPIAVSVVKLVKMENSVLHVKYLDAINGTPVLDVKPHFRGLW